MFAACDLPLTVAEADAEGLVNPLLLSGNHARMSSHLSLHLTNLLLLLAFCHCTNCRCGGSGEPAAVILDQLYCQVVNTCCLLLLYACCPSTNCRCGGAGQPAAAQVQRWWLPLQRVRAASSAGAVVLLHAPNCACRRITGCAPHRSAVNQHWPTSKRMRMDSHLDSLQASIALLRCFCWHLQAMSLFPC
jgi:hypothetical protein